MVGYRQGTKQRCEPRLACMRKEFVMLPYVMLATDVVEEMPVSESAWVLEAGGLLLLFCAVGSILLGIAQGTDERTGGGRLIGYGVAMAAALGHRALRRQPARW